MIQLFEYLGARRHRNARRLRKELRHESRDLRKRLKKFSGNLDKMKIQSANRSGSWAATEVSAKALGLSASLAEPRTLNSANLHPYRIKIKKLRYLIQFAEGKGQDQLADSLRSCQDAIGEWHDFEEPVSIAKEQLDHGPGCRLLPALKKISRQKFDAALSLTEQMRRNWASPQHQAKKPHSVPGHPALRTVAAIAS